MNGANLRILVVDDNPMVLNLLRQELAELAPVTTAHDGADALVKAMDHPPDLIVTDYQMPSLDGRQLVEKLRSRQPTANIPVILVATRTDINEKLRALEDKVADFIEKPFFIRDAAARVKRVLDRITLEKMAREAPDEKVLRGSLAQMSAIDLLQSLEMGRKSCALTFTNGDDRCDCYFVDGQITHAVYGNIKGDDAVFKVLGWTAGNFTIDFEGRSDERSTTLSTQGLLMEGLRLVDEANRDADPDVQA